MEGQSQQALFGDATAGFVNGPTFTVNSTWAFDIGEGIDFDVDGNGDLVLMSRQTQAELLILRGDGAGGFSPTPLTIPVQNATASLTDASHAQHATLWRSMLDFALRERPTIWAIGTGTRLDSPSGRPC